MLTLVGFLNKSSVSATSSKSGGSDPAMHFVQSATIRGLHSLNLDAYLDDHGT